MVVFMSGIHLFSSIPLFFFFVTYFSLLNRRRQDDSFRFFPGAGNSGPLRPRLHLQTFLSDFVFLQLNVILYAFR